jgi:hypothetical protein
MNLIKNMVVSTLQLNRPRPPLHKGTQFVVPSEQEPSPPPPPPQQQQKAGSESWPLSSGPPVLLRHSPRFDPELAAVLRRLVMVLRPRGALPEGAEAFPVLAGPTLEGWFHVGSQLPWKQEIHLVCAVACCTATAEQVARRCTVELVAAGQPVLRGEVLLHADEETSSCTLDLRVPGAAREIRVKLTLQVSPLPSADMPELAGLRRVNIDGGNVGVFVPKDRAAVAKLMEASGAPASASGSPSLTAQLRMPSGWAWCPETQMFVRPVFMREALRWPPNVATAKLVGATVVLVGILYLITVVMLPEWGATLQHRRVRRSRGGV